jgi:hypothetical protein
MTKTGHHHLNEETASINSLTGHMNASRVGTADAPKATDVAVGPVKVGPVQDNMVLVPESAGAASAGVDSAPTASTASPASTWTPTVTPSVAQANACPQPDSQVREHVDLALRSRVNERDMEAMRLQVKKLSMELATCQAQKASLQAEVTTHKPEVFVKMTDEDLQDIVDTADLNYKRMNSMGQEVRSTSVHIGYFCDGTFFSPAVNDTGMDRMRKAHQLALDNSANAQAAAVTALEVVRTTNRKLLQADANVRILQPLYDEYKRSLTPTSMTVSASETSALAGQINDGDKADEFARRQDALNAEMRQQVKKEKREKKMNGRKRLWQESV